MQMRDSTVWIVLAVVVVGAFALGYIKLPAPVGGAIGGAPTGATLAPEQVAAGCPNTKTTTLNVRYQNQINSTAADWLASTIEVWQGSSRLGSVSTTVASASYATQSVNCPASGTYYTIGSSTANSINANWDTGAQANVYTTLQGSRASALEFRLLDSLANNNTYNSDVDGFTNGDADANVSRVEVLAAGDSKIFFLDARAITSAAQYGDHSNGMLICSTVESSVYDVFTLTGGKNLRSVPVPSAISGIDRACWQDVAVRSDEGYREWKITLHANLNPGTTNNITFHGYDFQNYVGKDGSIKNGITDDANAYLGSSDNRFNLQVS